MIYNVRHITAYRYESPVGFTRCTLRVFPVNEPGQRVLESSLEVVPAPVINTGREDFFGNQLRSLVIESPHKALNITIKTLIDVERQAAPHASLTPDWEHVRRSVLRSRSLAANAPAHYIFRSSLIPLLPELADYAKVSFRPQRPVLEAAIELMQRIKSEFQYDPKATEVTTPINEAFARRAGVCQDFAHIMISALRGLGVPAAYVSGYIRTIAPPGKPRLEGADASHAWVSVWCGDEFGWHDLDPTNAIQIAHDHIVVARGRDYADVSPVDGVILGSGGQKLTVSVDVEPVPADGLLALRA